MTSKQSQREALTRKEAADFLGISERTLFTMEREGRAPPRAPFAGRTVRYSIRTLRRWLDGELEDAAEHAS